MSRAINIAARVLLWCVVFASGSAARASAANDEPIRANPAPLAGTSADRIVAFGDVHGGAEELRSLLTALTLIDAAGNWSGGSTRLVSLGDLLDRGPDSRAVMDLLMALEQQAADAGGAVHLVLGNHELMNLTGDLRYVSKAEYAAFAAEEDPAERARAFDLFSQELTADAETTSQSGTASGVPTEVDVRAAFLEQFPPGYFAHRTAFSADGYYGSWLLSKPQVLELDRIAFVHGGLSDAFSRRPIDEFNELAKAELQALLATGNQLVADGRLSPWQDYLAAQPIDNQALPAEFMALRRSLQFLPVGPSWYRGTAGCHGLIERPRFEAVLAARGLERIVMGHTPTNPRIIQTRFEDRAVLADTGMYRDYYRGQPSAAIFSNGTMRTLTLTKDGQLVEIKGQPAIDVRANGGQEWLEGIRQALENIELRPDRTVEFEANARRLEVVWHRGNKRQQASRLAAYALDKLLGFGLVAPVLRLERDGRTGVAEVVPATHLSEAARVAGNLYRPNYCMSSAGSPEAQANDFDLLLALDGLMGQENRGGENVAYDRVTWLMYLTEHEKTFPRRVRLPKYMADQSILLPTLVADKLRKLDQAMLTEVLGEFLDERQIRAVIGRRDLLLERGIRAE
jgi:hypothetical protein